MFVSQMEQADVEPAPQQAIFRRYEKEFLANHVIERKIADSELECGLHCLRHGSCASINYKTFGIGASSTKKKTQEISDVDVETRPEFNHLVIMDSVRYLCLAQQII